MARLAIFIDGGHLDPISRQFGVRLDFAKLPDAICEVVAAKTPEPLDVLRTIYYHCPPYQSNPPTDDERGRMARYRAFTDFLRRLPRFEVREGRLQLKGYDSQGRPIFQQKRVDLLLGIDFALMCIKRQITHIALVAGDSDMIPALQVAKQEAVSVWLVHGPRQGAGGSPTYHQDLWQEADERFELTGDFLKGISR